MAGAWDARWQGGKRLMGTAAFCTRLASSGGDIWGACVVIPHLLPLSLSSLIYQLYHQTHRDMRNTPRQYHTSKHTHHGLRWQLLRNLVDWKYTSYFIYLLPSRTVCTRKDTNIWYINHFNLKEYDVHVLRIGSGTILIESLNSLCYSSLKPQRNAIILLVNELRFWRCLLMPVRIIGWGKCRWASM